ncbi:unnamed protein product [Cylindrotheca closterium]|uniref:Uncharacterized protein n=1 Tax=Cylindrotheca closterium TaxID=2856 RepID=A0AAD2G2R6_9STRA|nr:unnamed protein product [Cylindrotheca closterium]
MRERSLSVGEDLCGGAKPSFKHEQKCQDHTPMKPLRQISGGIPSQFFRFFSDHETTDDGSAADHTSVFSGITDTTVFSSFDGSWRSASLDTSSRIEALGPLRENMDESCSFNNPPPRKLVSSSSYMMRHTFREPPATKDRPPQPAVRQNSSPYDST